MISTSASTKEVNFLVTLKSGIYFPAKANSFILLELMHLIRMVQLNVPIDMLIMQSVPFFLVLIWIPSFGHIRFIIISGSPMSLDIKVRISLLPKRPLAREIILLGSKLFDAVSGLDLPPSDELSSKLIQRKVFPLVLFPTQLKTYFGMMLILSM